jgi:hypothetical protein
MDADTERKLREHLGRTLGREVTEDEWAALLRAAGETPPESTAVPAPRAVRAGRALASGTVTVLAWVVGPLLVGAVVYGLVLGLMWAYYPSGLEDEDLGTGALLAGAWFVGFLTIGSVSNWPRASAVVLILGGIVGGLALAIGALLQAAG